MAKINVRSPYFINLSTTNLTSAQLEIQIYFGGANTSWQSSPQYTLSSTAINSKVNFEISELIKDYITALFDGSFPTNPASQLESTTINVDYRVTETINTTAQTPVDVLGERAFYGYGYFEDGVNPQLNVAPLLSNLTILQNDNEIITVPVDNENLTKIEWYLNGVLQATTTPTSGLKIQDQILYAPAPDFRTDQVKVFDNAGVTTTINVTKYVKCKYTPYKLTFINKFGAYQEIWMFANSSLSMRTTEDKYKSNILTNGTYSITNPQVKLLTKNGNQRLTLNSDFYPESYNEIFRQLFLSEKVWIYYDNQTLGVNIESKSINYKTSITDGLINYTIDVSFAFDTINNIR